MASRYAQRPRAPSPPRSPTSKVDNFNLLRRQQDDKKPQLPPARRQTTNYRPTVEDSYDTDNTYSVVQDDQTVEYRPPTKVATKAAPTQPTRMDRMFGDSEAENEEKKILNRRQNVPNGSLSSNASTNSSRRGGSLSSLYQARKSGLANYDSATVEQIKAQFQAQIESMLQSQERNNSSVAGSNNNNNNIKSNGQTTTATTAASSPLKNGHIPSAGERELNGIRDLQRGKSFVEARTAVQKQIERMFSSAQSGANVINEKTANNGETTSTSAAAFSRNSDDKNNSPQRRFPSVQSGSSLLTNPHNGTKIGLNRIQHTMHGVSHALPGDELDIEPPPPMHYGIDQALKNGSVALNNRRPTQQQQQQENVKNFFSNEDLRNVGRSEGGGLQKSPAMKRLAQSHDSLNFQDSIENELSPSPLRSMGGRSRGDISVQTDKQQQQQQQHLGNIDISNSNNSSRTGSSQQRLSRSTGSESPSSSTKTGLSSFASSRSSPASPPQRNASAPSSRGDSNRSVPNSVPAAIKKQYVRHKVDYLGALPISSSKSTSLTALQRPLKDLYFKWRALRNLGQTNLPGTLEINDTGLTVQYIREMHKGVQEIFNPFPTIAVWAAVKFVHKRDLVQSEPQIGPRGGVVSGGNYVLHRFAFLPLISDPEGNDKSRLFHELDGEHEVELAADSPHPPLFACVMRRTGGQKILECHGFVCASSEDAIIIAANLYQALLETMKKQKQKQKTDSLRRNEKGEDSINDDQGSLRTTSVFSDSDATTNTNTPIRPPRRKKTTRSSNDGSVASSMLQRRRSTRSSVRSNRSNRSTRSNARKRAANTAGHNISFVPDQPFRRSNTRLGRSDSGRKSDFSRRGSRRGGRETSTVDTGPPRDLAPPPSSMKGDVYTRVAIPRSKSFMNVSSQYNLQELFRELKEKEGVESIDDVLKKIISPNGISFNEIKPVYRELLLKLAMTMSQDEIFQRSKNIIHQEKKKMKNKKSKNKKSYPTSASEQSTLSSFLRMTFSSSKSNSQQQQQQAKGTLEQSKKSLSGYDTGISLLSKSSSSNKILTKADISGPIPLNGTTNQTGRGLQSASAKTPIMPRAVQSKPIPQLSETNLKPPVKSVNDEMVDDAYNSCSECGYESVCTYDSCSCQSKTASPKKYQPAVTHKNHSKLTTTLSDPDKIQVDAESVCDCDADSCVSSDKCYCSLRGDPRQNKSLMKPKSKLTQKLLPILSDDGETSSCCSSHSSSCGNNTINRTREIISTDSGTDTTCYSVRHISHKAQINNRTPNSRDISLSRVESPQTAWKRNSNLSQPASSHHHWASNQAESCLGSEYSDALPLSQIGLSSASVISSGSSSINSCKICQVNHFKHHSCCMSDDEGHSSPLSCELHRKNSGGSGYQSNDSYSSPQTSPVHSHHHDHHQTRLNPNASRMRSLSQDNLARMLSGSTGSGCSCSSSCSGSLASRGSHHVHGRPRLSLAKSSSHLLMDIDNNHQQQQQQQLTQQKRSLSQQKVLMVQAVDRSGKVVYRGASNSHLDKIDSEPMTSPINENRNKNVGSGSNVMSMKKSAEIAAVFSGAKINQTTNIVDNYNDDEETSSNQRRQQHSFSEANMQSSLGYFP